MICEEVKKPESKYEVASTLLVSERPFGQVHLLWQIFGLEEEEEVIQSDDYDNDESNGDAGTGRCPSEMAQMMKTRVKIMKTKMETDASGREERVSK
jgi:hypothetical protein